MQSRSLVYYSAAVAGGIGFVVGQFVSRMLLDRLFPVFVGRLAPATPEEAAAAAFQAGIACACAAVMIPLSALVTEKLAKSANYMSAMLKSLAVFSLVLILVGYYQSESLASQQRLFDKLPGLFGGRLPDTQLAANPITRSLWIGALFLLVFGPVDLWIARQQLAYRSRRSEARKQAATPAPAAVPADS